MEDRPRKPPLDAQRIAVAALELMDTEGAGAFTMVRLAARLGVRAPSLYNHVGGKGEIVEGVRDLVVAEMDWSAFATQPWDVALEAFARSYRAAFARHPTTVPLLTATPVEAPGALAMYDDVCAALVRAGWPHGRVITVVASVEYMVLGSVLDLTTTDELFGAAAAAEARTLAACLRASAHDREHAAQAAFDLGIAGLLLGLRMEFEAYGRSQPARAG
jgi:AcrR family transcriptional regulator